MTRRPTSALRRITHRVAAQRERGSSTIEMVILLPSLLAVMFLGVQAALMYQGRTIALAAAQEGARAAAAENGSASAGIAAAKSYVATTTAGLEGTTVSGSRSATEAQITGTTKTVSLVPGWKPTIKQSASMPVERVTG